MKRILIPLILAAMLLAPLILAPKGSAQAGTAEELRATYLAFVAAQNDHDPERIGAFFIDGPDFLWVSDGKSFWGREAVLARMGSFQKAALWRVEPDLDKVRISEVTPQSAIFHVPLTLVIGSAEKPDRLRFLVSAVFVKQASGWRIAALLTTTEKP